MVTSNIEITAADGNVTRGNGGEAFGCHIIVDGDAYASLNHVLIRCVCVCTLPLCVSSLSLSLYPSLPLKDTLHTNQAADAARLPL